MSFSLGKSKSKSSSQSQSQSTSTNTLDPTLSNALYGNVQRATAAADSLTPYTGQRVAGFNDTQLSAQNDLTNLAHSNVGGSLLNTAGQAASAAAAYKPQTVNSTAYTPASVTNPAPVALNTAAAANAGPAAQATAAGADRGAVQNVSTGPITADQISAYFNPYQSSVVDATNADLQRQKAIDQLNNAAAATKAGAFGGTGAAVLSSLTNDNYTRQMATADANLNSQGYNTALAAAQADVARKLTADQGNQNIDLGVATTNAGLLNTTNLANASTLNSQAALNSGYEQQANLANAAAGNQNAQFNTSLANATDLANASAANSAAQFNAGQDLAAQQANQQAGLNANSQAISAGGLLGNLSNEQQSQAITNAGLLGQVGDAQQAQSQKELSAALQAYQDGQALTQQQQAMVNSALALLPVTGTVSDSGTSSGQATGQEITAKAAYSGK
jgi:hypothetical protein